MNLPPIDPSINTSTPLPTQNTNPSLPPLTTTNTATPNIKSDNTSFSNVAQSVYTQNNTSSNSSSGIKAGFFKRMMNGVSNTFGKVADMMGMGTFSRIAKNQFNANDFDKSNHLNQQEFTAIGQMIQKSFQDVDRNGNQEISLGEFKTVVRDIVEGEMKLTDTNQDGFINREEATARNMVNTQGSQDSFSRNDVNGDGLLNLKEFAGMMDEQKLRKNQ